MMQWYVRSGWSSFKTCNQFPPSSYHGWSSICADGDHWLQIYPPSCQHPFDGLMDILSPYVCVCVCVLLDVLSPTVPHRIPYLFRYKIWQTPEAGHYQCYLLIHQPLMKCMVHSEWPHQVVKLNLQLIFQFSSLLWIWQWDLFDLFYELIFCLPLRKVSATHMHPFTISPSEKVFFVFSQNPTYPQWTLHCTLLGCQRIDKDFGGLIILGFEMVNLVCSHLCEDTSDRIYYAWCPVKILACQSWWGKCRMHAGKATSQH